MASSVYLFLSPIPSYVCLLLPLHPRGHGREARAEDVLAAPKCVRVVRSLMGAREKEEEEVSVLFLLPFPFLYSHHISPPPPFLSPLVQLFPLSPSLLLHLLLPHFRIMPPPFPFFPSAPSFVFSGPSGTFWAKRRERKERPGKKDDALRFPPPPSSSSLSGLSPTRK